MKELSEAGRQVRNEYTRQWKQRNKDKQRQYHKQWRARNKDKIRQYQASYWERRASKQMLPGKPMEILPQGKTKCLVCGSEILSKRIDAKFCSSTCRQRYYRQKK